MLTPTENNEYGEQKENEMDSVMHYETNLHRSTRGDISNDYISTGEMRNESTWEKWNRIT